MIEVQNITKEYPVRGGSKTVLDDISFTVARGEKLCILGGNGAGKSTLIRIISGAELPTSGRVVRNMSVSWPLALGGSFQKTLSGYDNLKFICRIYGVDYQEKLGFVDEFTGLGRYLREPVTNYSRGMRSRLAFGISLAIEFDCYLMDEVTSVGDAEFREKCHYELFERRKDRAMLIVSHLDKELERYCDRAALLADGKLKFLDAANSGEMPRRRRRRRE